MNIILLRALAILGMALAITFSSVVLSQTYPSKPIRFIVPYAPGGGADIVARAIGQKLAESMGQSVIIDNRPGGGTIIGTELAATSAPDGYVLFMATGAHTSNPSLYKKLPYDTAKAFAPVSLAASSPFLLIVNPSLPAGSVREFISYARTKQLNYGISATGAPDHLGMELLKSLVGIDLVRIPYKGAGPALIDLIGGQIPVMFANIVAALPHVRSGKVRALAATTIDRSALMPNLPTVAESGVPGFDVSAWSGVLVPAGTARNIIARLNSEIIKSLQTGDIKERLLNLGAGLIGSTPEHFGEFLVRETEKWAKVVKRADIQLD